MPEVRGWTMLSDDDDDDSPEKCRERRRRRIEMRRLASSSSGRISPATEKRVVSSNGASNAKRIKIKEKADFSYSTGSNSSVDDLAASTEEEPSDTASNEPVFGTMSVSGRARKMEDEITVRTSLCKPEINGCQPVHFFAVYDGHGGPHVAAMCRERMYILLQEELMGAECVRSSSSKGKEPKAPLGVRVGDGGDPELEKKWKRVMERSFERMDEVALTTCACGSLEFRCGCHQLSVAFEGSTAVVAVLTQTHIVVANCGDSRAVLCRGNRAIPLSFDHKPDRSDELARIEAIGAKVLFTDGPRVEGILAMSRAIGDKYLKPIVISDPEVTITKREPGDECLILASDGLWDVVSCELACQVACECLREGNTTSNAKPRVEDEEAGALYPSPSKLAAAILTRLALGRQSSDNISVIVVDLKNS